MSFDTERMPLYRLQVWSQTSDNWLDTERAVPDLAFLMRMADAHMSIMRGLPTITFVAVRILTDDVACDVVYTMRLERHK